MSKLHDSDIYNLILCTYSNVITWGIRCGQGAAGGRGMCNCWWSLVTPAPPPPNPRPAPPPPLSTQSCRYRLLVGSCSERRPVAGGALSTQQPHGDSLILLWTHGHYDPHITLSQHYNKYTKVNRDPGAVYTETHSVIIVILTTAGTEYSLFSLSTQSE